MTPNQSHVAGLELAKEHLWVTGSEYLRLEQLINQAKSTPTEPVQEEVEVVATVTVSFDEGDEGSAIETVALHVLLDEGDTDLMTVAQHKRLMAAKPDAELVELLQHSTIELNYASDKGSHHAKIIADRIDAKLASLRA